MGRSPSDRRSGRASGGCYAATVQQDADNDPIRWATEEQFAESCRWEAFRGPGPGGQKRNKTSSAVRVVHPGTGLSAIAGESRSQTLNRATALRRLRHKLVLQVRSPIERASFQPPPWLEPLLRGSRIAVPRRGALYLPTIGLILDLLDATAGSVADAAAMLSLSTAALVRFIQHDPKLLAAVNRLRERAGHHPLAPRRP